MALLASARKPRNGPSLSAEKKRSGTYHKQAVGHRAMTAPLRLDPASLDALRDGSLDAADAARLADALRVKPGQRSWLTQARLCERDRLICAAARTRFWPNSSAAEFARAFHWHLARYHDGPWRRDRCCTSCPAKYLGTAREILWQVLRVSESVLSERRLRHIVGRELPPFDGHRRDAP
ncbi:hypothetical protein FXV83_15175 [Bradyrhizobium hipponense]|uniref:Uncharacterized protein n=1 Tax=Bradyrhizobium hipponense TaxID=2605638 RepID=A0A5S4YMW1_9BRAD|nr:hypothetical protein [Bradyrhizobium hipponense]TYO65756.1 hypothetical protein FXV83_15175 [Bradyrhizobium hipponense]